MALTSSARIDYEPLRSLAFGGISGVYAGVGTPFVNPVRMILINNFTDANLLISFNGITDNHVIAADSGQVLDYCSNMADQAGILEQPAGKRVYVKQESTAATLGTVYVTVIFANQV